MHPAAFDGDFFGKTATAAAQADEVHVFGEVVVAAFAGLYGITDDVGFDHNVLSDFEVVHAFADGINHAGELVSHRYGCGLAGNRVRMAAGRNENRTFHKFVQVGTADTAPGDVDADGAVSLDIFSIPPNQKIKKIIKNTLFSKNTEYKSFKTS